MSDSTEKPDNLALFIVLGMIIGLLLTLLFMK
jgi:hypothetical protein